MTETTDLTDVSDSSVQPDGPPERDPKPSDVPALVSRAPKIGVLAWSFVGFVVATVIVVTALAAVSEILLPLLSRPCWR